MPDRLWASGRDAPNSVAKFATDEISDLEFSRLMVPFEPLASPIAIAVSGGADSMGLAALMVAWAQHRKIGYKKAHQKKAGHSKDLFALIVDHGLRENSAQEATLTQHRLTALGLESQILRRHGGALTSAVQAQAREARYELLNEACKMRGCLHLLTAHHAGDQAETVAMRRRRSPSNDSPGLAGMQPRRITGDTELLRPVLNVERGRLMATCKMRGIDWVDDPSNFDSKFERVRVRQHLEQDRSEREALLALAAQMDHSRKNTLHPAIDLIVQTTVIHPDTVSINIQDFLKSEPCVQAEALAICLARIGVPVKPVSFRTEQLERAITASFKQGRQISLGRCVLSLKKGQVIIYRDPRIVAKTPPQPFCAGVIPHSRAIWP